MGIFDFFRKKKNQDQNEIVEPIAPEVTEQAEPAVELTVENNAADPVEDTVENAVETTAATTVENTVEDTVQTATPSMTADMTVAAQPSADTASQAAVTPVMEEVKPETIQESRVEIAEESENVSEEVVTEVLEEVAASVEEMVTEPVSEPEVQEEAPVKKGFFQKLMAGLTKTRDHVMQGVNQVLSSFTSIDEDFYEELEEALILGDLGVNTAIKIVAGLREKVKAQKIKDPQAVKALLKEELKEQMHTTADAYDFVNKKSVVLVIGVNGVGKTTTIGKLASQYKKAGKNVMLAAADTFRAAAIDQLKEWARRVDVPIIAQSENSDPGAVVFDAIASAKSRNVDILICDTAGRLHNKKNLMAELGKIYRIIGREYPEAHLEVLLVLDSTTGQNALVQAKEFKEMADITGIVLTKLDGTSKGGIAIAITADLKLPVKYIGIGEGVEDLRPFDSDTFVDALFGEASVKDGE